MKKLTPAKKLQLTRESLAQLGDTQLRQVIGGGGESLFPNHCQTKDNGGG